MVIPADIVQAAPRIWPFDPALSHAYALAARPLPKPLFQPGADPRKCLAIDAVLVLSDPRDWAVDCQLVLDAMLAPGGVIGMPYNVDALKRMVKSRTRHAQSNTPETHSAIHPPGARLYFSQADTLWQAGWHLPRLALGTFEAAMDGVWRRVTTTLTGSLDTPISLPRTLYGKPSLATFSYADKLLGSLSGHESEGPRTVYMIGDNPESDIAGANNWEAHRRQFPEHHSAQWVSVLVRTGVWNPMRDGLSADALPPQPGRRPAVSVNDVLAAMQWVMRQEGHSH